MMAVRNSRILGTITLILIAVILCPISHGKIIYVDDDTAGANNGTSWADAYTFLQEALAEANEAEKPVEIRVANGTYRPDEYTIHPDGTGNQESSFRLIRDVAINGGYAGIRMGNTDIRNIDKYVTIFTGDLNQNDIEITTPPAIYKELTREDNSHYVVTAAFTNLASLDGVIITSGECGMHIENASPMVTNCIFTQNSGRGIVSEGSGGPKVVNCSFINNFGGGAFCWCDYSTFVNCIFKDNFLAEEAWGAGLNLSSRLFLNRIDAVELTSTHSVTGCQFIGNETLIWGIFSSHFSGGGMEVSGCNCIVNNCVFSRNSAFTGSGIYVGAEYIPAGFKSIPIDTRVTVVNCTFTENNGVVLVGDANSPPHQKHVSVPSINYDTTYNVGGECVSVHNCIFHNNLSDTFDSNHFPSVEFSNVPGGFAGTGNIDIDPLFAAPSFRDLNGTPDDPNDDFWVEGNYHLQSLAGRWDPNSQSWILDDATSPCIDAGDPNSDWAGEIWPHGGRINMGAYGGTRQASMSLETEGMSLAHVAYIYSQNDEVAENFQSLLGAYGCPTTLIRLTEVTATLLDSYDLIIVADDTENIDTWSDPNSVAVIEDSNKPVIGLGEGGYTFFGELGLAIGSPNGAHGSNNSIEVVDPNSSLFSTPYSIEIPQDQTLQLYTETKHVGLYLWPTIPESVTVLAREANNFPYCSLAIEHNRYLLWTFTESPQKMTEVGKTLFINLVIHTANKAWESNI